MLTSLSSIILGILLIMGRFETFFFDLFDLTCLNCVSDMGCSVVSLTLTTIGLFLIVDGIYELVNFWRVAFSEMEDVG